LKSKIHRHTKGTRLAKCLLVGRQAKAKLLKKVFENALNTMPACVKETVFNGYEKRVKAF
jgi:hypothetical protein